LSSFDNNPTISVNLDGIPLLTENSDKKEKRHRLRRRSSTSSLENNNNITGGRKSYKMMMKWYFGRFLLRQYIYPAIVFLLLILLIKWNSQPQKIIIEHGNWREKTIGNSNIVKSVNTLPKPPQEEVLKNEVIDGGDSQSVDKSNSILGNTVHVSIYMEAQCPDTSRFIKRQLVPTWQRLRSTGRVEFNIVPFGKARCEPVNDNDYKCECQHGEDECLLNQLMNCAMHEFGSPDHYIPIIGCIQGSDNLESAIKKCIENGNYHQYEARLRQCATGPRGRHLLALAGQKTAALKPALTFVPWVMLENERVVDAFYALEENVCKKFEPRPDECQRVSGVPNQ
jgi:interferon gamma-inducible protein 30